MQHAKSGVRPTPGYVALRGARVGILAVLAYALAFMVYAVVRSSFTLFATVNQDAGLWGTLLASWVSLIIPALTIALLLFPLGALFGIVTALVIWGISAAWNREQAPNKAVAIGVGTCIVIAVLLVVLLNQGLGVTWTRTLAETLTFWLALPLLVYIAAGGAASWALNRRLGAPV
jgi:hypothetical protein